MDNIQSSRRTRVIRIVIYATAIAFFAAYLSRLDYGLFREIQLAPRPLVVSLLLAICFRYWGVFVWRMILIDLGSKDMPRLSVLASVYAKAWMTRYIPGSVAWLAGKVVLASDLGISKSRLAVASLTEALVQVVALTVMSGVLLLSDARIIALVNQVTLLILAAIVFIGFAVMLPPVFNTVVRRLFRLFTGKPPHDELSTNYQTLIRSFLLYIVGGLISGTAYFFLCRTMWPVSGWQDWMFVMAATNLAGALGMATPLVPSGLGVRDVSMLMLLSILLPAEAALVVTASSRLWSALADVLFLFSTGVHHRLKIAA